MKILNLHYRDTGNIGDMLCTPMTWFGAGNDVEFGDIRFWQNHDIRSYDAVIVGGGGLINAEHQPHMWALSGVARKLVLWGIGPNDRNADKSKIDLPMALTGIRIKKHGDQNMELRHEFVPCASCMSDMLDRHAATKPTIRNVIVGHPWFVKKHRGELSNAVTDFNLVLSTLARAKRVITNSYHFMYWSVLMGREVVILDAWSSKFWQLPWNAPRASSLAEAQSIECGTNSGALEDCRKRNVNFYEKVKNYVNE
jgi:hypothetical protein